MISNKYLPTKLILILLLYKYNNAKIIKNVPSQNVRENVNNPSIKHRKKNI